MTEPEVDAPAGAPPSVAPAKPRRRPWQVAAVVLASALGAAAIGANFIRVPYIITSPGEATPLDADVVSITGAPTYSLDDDLLFLTVRVSNRDPNLWRYLFALLDDDVSVDKREEVIGCQSYAESTRLNDLLMSESQDAATTVALRRLGYEVVEEGNRVVVVDVLCDGPSRDRLMAGDVITAVDGTPVAVADDVRPLVVAHSPGERLRVTVDRGGETREVDLRLGERDGAAFMGIRSQTVTEQHFPFSVKIDTRSVSGPSAGLAFTLAIIDELTPGDLTGNQRVAVTGSILPDGTVQVVGGVPQKTVTARERGVSLMLVPRGEAREARSHAGDMRVVAVGTIDEALQALEQSGGDPVEADQ